MSTEEPTFDARLRQRVHREVDRRFYGTWSGAVGTAAAALIITVLMWPYADHQRLVTWAVFSSLVSVGLYLANTLPSWRRHRTEQGMAKVASGVSALSGTTFGAVAWIDGSIMADAVARTTLCAVFLALTAGTVGGLAGIGGIGRFFAFPLWSLAILSLGVNHEWVLALGLTIFILIVAKDLSATSSTLYELLLLREMSKERAELAQRDARRDPLTGLLNRAGLEAATAGAGGDHDVTAMFIDLDHFKSVNDRFGHASGDKVLIEVAERLLNTVRPGDVVARLGGDEFLIVLTDELTERVRTRLAESIIARIEEPFHLETADARISASVGVTVLAAGSFDLSSAQREADHALYVAKELGRRRAVRFDDSVRSDLEQRSEIETALRGAVEREEIEAWGQPVYRIDSDKIEFVEVLARWKREDGTFCSPTVFIPLAEEIGLIGDLGKCILEQAGSILHRWADHPELRHSPISVNVSPRQLGDPDFVASVRSIIERWQLQAGKLILELTETADLHDLEDVHETLNELADLGVTLALDDFGSGYSSVQHLLGLPIEYVKIDGSLVSNLGTDAQSTSIVRSIRDLALALGRRVVVEGVETEAQANHLAELDLNLVQGFLYSSVKRLGELEHSAGDRSAGPRIELGAASQIHS